MEYVEGEGFVLTKGGKWSRKLYVLQLVNSQGAWIDEVSMGGKGVGVENFREFIPVDTPYRVILRESVETILEIKH